MDEIETSIINSVDYSFVANYTHTTVWGALFSKEVVKDIMFSREFKVGEDTVFFSEAVLKANLIVDNDIPLYNYYFREDSLIHKQFDFDQLSRIMAMNRIIELFENNSIQSLQSCYGRRSLIALKCLIENCCTNGWNDPLNEIIINYIRKDIHIVLQSPMSFRSKKSLLFACMFPKWYVFIVQHFRMNNH